VPAAITGSNLVTSQDLKEVETALKHDIAEVKHDINLLEERTNSRRARQAVHLGAHMNHYEIIWQQPDGLTRDLWVYAKSAKAARQPIEEILEEGDRILSCKKRELTTTKGEPTRLSTTEAARLLDMTPRNMRLLRAKGRVRGAIKLPG
jgi:hypothetical protein